MFTLMLFVSRTIHSDLLLRLLIVYREYDVDQTNFSITNSQIFIRLWFQLVVLKGSIVSLSLDGVS